MLRDGEHHRHLLSATEPWARNNPMIKASIPFYVGRGLTSIRAKEYYLMHVLHILKFDSTFLVLSFPFLMLFLSSKQRAQRTS